jgi:general secretion pathway protein B
MSYILDALRKSEQERQVAAGQSAGVLYPVLVEIRRPGVTWVQLLSVVGTMCIVAVLAVWWWASRPAPHAPAPATVAGAPPQMLAAPAHQPVQEVASPAPVVPVTLDRPRPPAPAAATKRAARQAPMPGKTVPQPVARVVPPAEPASVAADAPLPELPPMRISGYVRDGGEGGMVMINDKLVREGEEVSPGLRLEKILPDGAVFSYKGRRFTR